MAMDLAPISGKLTSLSGRYAKTLFDLAVDSKELPQITAQFSEFCHFIKSQKDLGGIIFSPALSRQEHVAVFHEICQKLKILPLLINFMTILAENRRLELIYEIQEIFQELFDQNQGITHAEVVSAVSLSKQQQERILEVLTTQVSGKLLVNYLIDSAYLGGILVRIGNQIIDLTLADQLNHLANAMKGNA